MAQESAEGKDRPAGHAQGDMEIAPGETVPRDSHQVVPTIQDMLGLGEEKYNSQIPSMGTGVLFLRTCWNSGQTVYLNTPINKALCRYLLFGLPLFYSAEVLVLLGPGLWQSK